MLRQKRKQGKPNAYILGQATFMGRTFYCSPDTFVPTEQTSVVVDAAINFIKKREHPKNQILLLDVGTGCGNLSIALALNSNYTTIFASDISTAAIAITKKNVSRYNLEDKILLFTGDLFSPVRELGYEGKVDIIISNPPYIPTGSLGKLPREIIHYGPRLALDGGPFGINLYRRLIKESASMLKPDGILLFETGEKQENLIVRIFEDTDEYEDIKYYRHRDQIRAMSAIKKKKL